MRQLYTSAPLARHSAGAALLFPAACTEPPSWFLPDGAGRGRYTPATADEWEARKGCLVEEGDARAQPGTGNGSQLVRGEHGGQDAFVRRAFRSWGLESCALVQPARSDMQGTQCSHCTAAAGACSRQPSLVSTDICLAMPNSRPGGHPPACVAVPAAVRRGAWATASPVAPWQRRPGAACSSSRCCASAPQKHAPVATCGWQWQRRGGAKCRCSDTPCRGVSADCVPSWPAPAALQRTPTRVQRQRSHRAGRWTVPGPPHCCACGRR